LLSPEAVASQLGTDLSHGLSEAEAKVRLQAVGENRLIEGETLSWWGLLLEQFKDLMILVLVAAGVVSGVVGEWIDTLVILIIVALNAIIGTVQAYRAEQAIATLKAMAEPETQTRRDGQWRAISSALLVPGDVVRLEAGNVVPADLRLIGGHDVVADESALTGESIGVVKLLEALDEGDYPVADQVNRLFKGTQISRGTGEAIVVATGMQTELGKIAGLLQSSIDSRTPLQNRLDVFSRRLAFMVLAICALVFVAGLVRGEPVLLMLLTAISLAVAAIPEALPAVISVSLALGARKMGLHNALMRNLPSVETLGSVTYICSDKTGTLTLNQMQAEGFYDGSTWRATFPQAPEATVDALANALLLNNDLTRSEGDWQGEATELALCQAAEAAGYSRQERLARWPRVDELAFDSVRKRMTTAHRVDGALVTYTKGAPEQVIPRCVPAETRETWMLAAQERAAAGYRVLAVAVKRYDDPARGMADKAHWEDNMQLVGLVALMDPPRDEARQAVEECKRAGITPVMITGDHPATASAIADKLGIQAQATPAMTGAQMDTLSDAEMREAVAASSVYARVSPEQKVRLVQALQARGEYCAMTGDGVNDAPALKRANIGVAMGNKGTDVAREASDMVLLDDNFATIVTAVREGRRVFDNIRKFIKYTMTSNAGEIWVLLLAPFFGLPLPLLPIHILWVNLVTDGLPGLALTAEPAARGIMDRPPRPPHESIFARGMWQQIIWIGGLIAAVTLGLQAWAVEHAPEHWQTLVFTVLVFAQLFNALLIRSEQVSLLTLGLGSNPRMLLALVITVALQLAVIYLPWCNDIFRTQPLSLSELALCFVLGSTILLAGEAEKVAIRRGWIYRAATPSSAVQAGQPK
jgi:Ca2+-transporting ATPase